MLQTPRVITALALAASFVLPIAPPDAAAIEPAALRRFEEVRRWAAGEARQGVAADAAHFYAVGNRSIGKYDKRTGEKVAEWVGADDGPVVHLNSGIVLDGKLYCAHSNYPATPMTSSIEIFDTATLSPVDSHSFGIFEGSATWIDRRNGSWWVTFAHYEGRGGEAGKGPDWTSLVRLDATWRRTAGYVFPSRVVERFRGRSSSGGSWGDDGLLYATGHDAAEVYVLRLPRAGSVLDLVEILPAPVTGQGIAWDRTEPGVLYGIVKQSRQVVVSRRIQE